MDTFESSFDSIIEKNDSIKVYVHLGSPSNQIFIKNTYVDDAFLQGVKMVSNTLYTLEYIQTVKEKILENAENNGYPFATIKLDSFRFSASVKFPIANLVLIKNDKIIIDTIIIDGKARIRNKFLAAYLKLKSGSLYNESTVQLINKHIADFRIY